MPEALKKMLKSWCWRLAPNIMNRRQWAVRGDTYHQEPVSELYQHSYEFLADLGLKDRPGSVLEYGCGYGYLLKTIHERSPDPKPKCHGIDFSTSQIEKGRLYFPKANFRQVDLTKSSGFAGLEPSDLVIGFGVLMYLTPRDISSAILNLKTMCRKRFMSIEYDFKYLDKDKKRQYLEAQDGRFVHDYESLFREAGFRTVESLPIPPMEDPSINKMRSMPHRLIMCELD